MNKYLPAILFGICIVIALILAWTMQPQWPAALAIAIAGAALALSMREPAPNDETTYLSDEIAVLQNANADLREELATTHSMIDELAEVVEQIAGMASERASGASPEQLGALQATLGALETRVGATEADTGALDRIGMLEARLEEMQAAPQRQSIAAEIPQHLTGDASDVRSLIARANGQPEQESAFQAPLEPTPEPTAPPEKVSLTPVFHPNLGAPVAFVVASSASDTVEAVPGLFKHAAQIARELESAKKEIRLFVRLSPMALEHLTVRRDVLAAVDAEPALQRRLTILTPQDGYGETVQNTLAAIADRGCTFALDNVRDWSINLAALSRAGLSHIVVDGIAMAQSAHEQGGDPRRLAQALAAHKIALIAGGVMIREDIETVRQLDPALVMGDGLGIPRLLDGAA